MMRKRYTKISRVLAWLVMAAAWLTGQGCVPPEKTVDKEPAQAVLPQARPGFTVLLSGNWNAHLEPCGCADKQLGGIDRRTETIERLAPQSQSRLLLDAGPLVEKDDRQSQLKLEVFVKSLKTLNFDAIALTPLELMLVRDKLGLTTEDYPPVVATNLPEEIRTEFGLNAVIRKELVWNNKQLNCLILAVYDPQLLTDPLLQEQFKPVEPVQAITDALLGERVDPAVNLDEQLVMVLTPGGDETLAARLADIAAIDLICGKGYGDDPQLIAPTADHQALTVALGVLGKYMARISLPPEHKGMLTRELYAPVEIAAEFPRDARIVKYLDEYQMAMQAEDLIGNETLAPRMPLPGEATFTGNSSCIGCHRSIFQNWSFFKHAHAMETLMKPEISRQFDPECVACHTVGMRYQDGYRSMEETPGLGNVGCEACHGPGSVHIREASEAYAKKEKCPPYQVIFTRCEACHTHENSPPFEKNREQYFDKIHHWILDPRQYWQ